LTEFECRNRPSSIMLNLEYLGRPFDKWNVVPKPEEGDSVRIRIEFGRDGSGSSERVLLEQAGSFVQKFHWLKPLLKGWSIECDEMRKQFKPPMFPLAEFPEWFQGTVAVNPVIETEGRRSTTITHGQRIEGRSVILKIVFVMTKDDVSNKSRIGFSESVGRTHKAEK
jgi:hypothetical protein